MIKFINKKGSSPSPSEPFPQSEDYESCLDLIDKIKHNMEYTELEYIQSSGSQWTNPNLMRITSSTRIEMTYQLNSLAANQVILGFYGTGWNCLASGADGVSNRFGISNWGANLFRLNNIINQKVTLKLTGNTVEYNGTLYNCDTYGTVKDDTNTHEVMLLTSQQNTAKASCKVYSFKIYEGETLIRDLIPAKTPDNIVCFYDKVTGSLYKNRGSGNFIAGGVVYD